MVPTAGGRINRAGTRGAIEGGRSEAMVESRGLVDVIRERKLSNNDTTRLRVGDGGVAMCPSEESFTCCCCCCVENFLRLWSAELFSALQCRTGSSKSQM